MRAHDRLSGLPRLGDGIGLNRVARALRLLNLTLPPSIKVTGSNGKGSTAAMCAAILNAHGLRTGLYTSPHLLCPSERINIDGPLAPWKFAHHLDVAASALEGTGHNAFELLTVAAAHAFAGAGLDYIVWEAGIGGRHDPTRLMPGSVAIITQVALQHTTLLGQTLADIAMNKADILDTGTLVVAPQVEPFLGDTPGRRVVVAHDVAPQSGLLGAHQRHNARCATRAVKELLGAAYSPNATISGLDDVRWPGRFEQASLEGTPVIIDVAHDPSALRLVVATLEDALPPNQPVTVVFGCSTDRPAREMLEAIAPATAHHPAQPVVMTAARHKGTPADQLCGIWRGPSVAIATVDGALAYAVTQARSQNGVVLVTGGLFLAAEALATVKKRPTPIFY